MKRWTHTPQMQDSAKLHDVCKQMANNTTTLDVQRLPQGHANSCESLMTKLHESLGLWQVVWHHLISGGAISPPKKSFVGITFNKSENAKMLGTVFSEMLPDERELSLWNFQGGGRGESTLTKKKQLKINSCWPGPAQCFQSWGGTFLQSWHHPHFSSFQTYGKLS